jgi:hypothetical protein
LSEIITHRGHNSYPVPHMHKDTLERQGNLPVNISLSDRAIQALEEMEIFDTVDD